MPGPGRYSCIVVASAVFCLLCLTSRPCSAQDRDVVCRDGSGAFKSESSTGVTVQVRAARIGALATRACAATLSWGKNILTITGTASQVDLDTFGVDLGLGAPVATFQLQKPGANCCPEYQVYSLAKPPRLLRTITGGEFFSAADTDLDGRIEIWTNDAASVRGFENLTIADLDSPPAIVLRFEHGKLLDVGSEFQAYFDQQITRLRKELDSEALRDFKNSDGKLSPSTPLPVETLHQLRGVKAKVLEITWCYLYSGREPQAWRALAEMWPAADLDRIRAGILNARAHGMLAQVDGVSSDRPGKKKHATIFNAVSESPGSQLELTPPKSIMLRLPPSPEVPGQDSSRSEALLDLVIDSAGKVRSAEPAGKATSADAAALAAGWKFIPAFKDGRAVASRTRLAVSPQQ